MRKIFTDTSGGVRVSLPQLLTVAATLFLTFGIIAGKNAIEVSQDTRSLAAGECTPPASSGRTSIASTASLCPDGNYAKGIDITGNDLTLDCQNVAIDGGQNTSEGGIEIGGKNNVTVKNCSVKGFFAGLRVKTSSNITVDSSTFSENSKGGRDQDWLAELMTLPDTGGGIIFQTVTNSKITNSTASQNIAGVSLFDSQNIEVHGGDYSNNSGWGVRLIRTSDSKVISVMADNNNRVNSQCPSGGCESAGILLMENSNNNRIENNSLNNGGDGFYINGNGGAPSNNNVIVNNTANADSEYVSGNGFEATFSEGNIFEKNTSNGHNYGFWLGFSEKSVLSSNTVEAVQGGISIPASKCNAIINNTAKNGDSSEHHIFTESEDMLGKSRVCKDNYLTNNSPALDTDDCINTSSEPIASCNLNITPQPTTPISPTGSISPTLTPTPRTGGSPTTPPRTGRTTLRIEVWVTRTGQTRRPWNSSDGQAQVYIKGPTARGADRFSVVMSVPTSSGVFQDTEGHYFRGEPGVILWAGAGTSQSDPGGGTTPGRYTTKVSALPTGLGPLPYPNVYATLTQGQTGVAILDVVEGNGPWPTQPPQPTTPPGDNPTPTPRGENPTPTPSGECNCPKGRCFDDCSRGTGLNPDYQCQDGEGPDANYLWNYCKKPPRCCDFLKQEGVKACCWPERAYCTDNQCSQAEDRQGSFCGKHWHDGICTNPQPNTQNIYTNEEYQRVINQYANGELTALEVSLWISEASRSPGLQLSTCDPTTPGECEAK